MRERRGAYRILMGKREGRRQIGRSWNRWQDSIKTGDQEIAWEA
jgi:hypothetical protein